MQIKEIWFVSMDLNCECGQLVAKSIISNDGELGLGNCNFTKSEFKAFSVGLGDKHVIKL